MNLPSKWDKRKEELRLQFLSSIRQYLFSQAVSSQVFSAALSLTSVFGMGTGVASGLSSPEWLKVSHLHDRISHFQLENVEGFIVSEFKTFTNELVVKSSTY